MKANTGTPAYSNYWGFTLPTISHLLLRLERHSNLIRVRETAGKHRYCISVCVDCIGVDRSLQ